MITINVYAISPTGENHDISIIDVNINEKLQKLADLLAVDNILGSFVHGSQILTGEKTDQTFSKLLIKDNEKLGIMLGAGVVLKDPIKWWRMCNFTQTSYDYIEGDNRVHALIFIPKCKVHFMGFGQFANYNNKNMNIQYQWILDGERSEWYNKEFIDSEKFELENQAKAAGYTGKFLGFDVHLWEDFGVKPIVVEEGQKLTIMCKSEDPELRVIYGYSGEPEERKKIEGQEHDEFKIEESEHNHMCTWYYYGQFPYILYNRA